MSCVHGRSKCSVSVLPTLRGPSKKAALSFCLQNVQTTLTQNMQADQFLKNVSDAVDVCYFSIPTVAASSIEYKDR